MIYTKVIVLIGLIFLMKACAPKELPVNKGGYYYSGIYFGSHFSKTFKRGIQDGCKTSKGIYTKSHWLFQNKKEYADAWFLGRNRCKGLLKINKNGDVIL